MLAVLRSVRDCCFAGLEAREPDAPLALLVALDACNRRFERGAVVPGSAGFAPRREWSTKFEMRSPRHTTRVEEIPVVPAA